MEQGGMERVSRLPSAPSRLPTVSGGARVQAGPPSGLPRLFGRVPANGPDMGYQSQSTTLPQQPTQKEDLTPEDDEWYSWIGKRVCISGIKKGILMYYGPTSFAEGMFCGISLDEPEGRHDGELNGHRYFTCPDKHGVFAPTSKVEKLGIPKLPPILSPEDLNRTFLSGKACNVGLNGTFTREKSPGNNDLNSTYIHSKATLNGSLDEPHIPVKSVSVGSDLDRTFNLKESPTATYPLQKTRHHNRSLQAQNPDKLICEETQLQCYDEEDSSLGLLTDSQMGDFSIEGLMLMPKTQSCDDINELPEHEVVQDITVQYLDESMSTDSIPFHSTPLSRTDIKQATFAVDHSISEERSFSMLADQDFPSLAYDFTIDTLTEDNKTTNVSSGDDMTHPLVSTEMPEEEVEVPLRSSQATKCYSSPSVSRATPVVASENQKPNVSSELLSSSLDSVCSGVVDLTTETGERFTVSREAVIGALVNSISKSSNLPLELLTQLTSSLSESAGSSQMSKDLVTDSSEAQVASPTDVHLLEKGQRSLETSLTKSVEWNDVVVVQHTGDETKEERMSIEKVMEVIQAKGQSGQRPASTYTVGSADTGYQGDGEFDMQSEIETASPCEEMKPLVSPSVSTSLSLDDMNASGTASSKMAKSGHLSDSDFFTEDPGEAEDGAPTPPSTREEPDQPSESVDDSAAGGSVVDETLIELSADVTYKIEEEKEGEDDEVLPDEVAGSKPEAGEASTEVPQGDASAANAEDIPKKSKKLPHSGPVKKVVGVSKIRAMLETQPSIEQPKRARTPKKSRWDAVTSKIQAGIEEEKAKPKREVRGRVNTNLLAARVTPVAPVVKREGPGSVGPASTRSTPITESVNLPADADETASQATTSARGTSSVLSFCSQRASGRGASGRQLSSSTASACSSSSSASHCSVVSSIPSTSQRQHHPPPSQQNTRMPSKIAVRLQPRLETVAKICEPAKKSNRPARTAPSKTQKAAPQTSKGVLHGTAVPPRVMFRTGATEPPILKPKEMAGTGSNSTRPGTTGRPQPPKSKGASPTTTPQTPTGPVGLLGRNPPATPSRSSLSARTGLVVGSGSPLVIPSSSRQQRQKLEELGREVQHLGALCESRTKELNRVKMQLRHAASGFDAFATLVQYLAGELNAFSHPDLVSEIQTTKEQLIKLESFLRQCEGDLEGMREKHAEEVNALTRQLQQAQEDTALLQEKLVSAERKHSKKCEEFEAEKERIQKEAFGRQQAALELSQAQHASQVEELSKEHVEELKAYEDRHKVEQEALTGQLDLMKEHCRKLQEQACSIEEALLKDTDAKIQWLSAKNADLQKEVESLKSVLEMKQDELHNLRKENQLMSKQAEEVAVYRQRVNKLMSRIEELQALLREKSKNERKLSCDQRSLQEHLDKESKINRQLSMEKEELLWRLSQSFNSSTGSLNASSFLASPEFLKMKRPNASTPFRLAPGSLPPFRENLQDESGRLPEGSDPSQVGAADTKPHRARVRVNRTRSCHTSPRNSPSHNSNSRMVASTPNMPCDDDNSVDDPSSSTKMSPCDSLTELHLKACMQLDCIDDLLMQQEQQQQQQRLYSPNGASSPNSGSASMTSSAAEDLSLSSTEEERRQENLQTSPRSQAGEAMTTVDDGRGSVVTPDSPRAERAAPPSDNNLSDTPCFCDDFDISSEPE